MNNKQMDELCRKETAEEGMHICRILEENLCSPECLEEKTRELISCYDDVTVHKIRVVKLRNEIRNKFSQLDSYPGDKRKREYKKFKASLQGEIDGCMDKMKDSLNYLGKNGIDNARGEVALKNYSQRYQDKFVKK